MSNWINNVLQIRKTKKGGISVVITNDEKVFQEFIKNVKPGSNIYCVKKEEDLKRQLDSGRIDEAKYQELLAKFSEWLKYEGHLAPPKA